MVAKINILNSCANVVAKIKIRVFKIKEQLSLKFGKKLRTARLNLKLLVLIKSVLYAVKNYGKFF